MHQKYVQNKRINQHFKRLRSENIPNSSNYIEKRGRSSIEKHLASQIVRDSQDESRPIDRFDSEIKNRIKYVMI